MNKINNQNIVDSLGNCKLTNFNNKIAERRKYLGQLTKMQIFLVNVFLLLCISCRSESAPVSSNIQAMFYLSQYGYLRPLSNNTESIIQEDTWSKAVMEFQSFAGLNVTGELDDQTKTLMSLPRCGVKDRVGFGSDSRSKRYALQGSRWRVKDLTYKIGKYPRLLNRADVDAEVAKAFNVWSGYTDLTFTQKKTGQVHIEVRFEKGEHGDGDPFDGPGGTLAHAYFPVYGGDAHFDDSEQWSINSYRGTNLFQVAAHEFGHSLGLSHSDVKSALMAPFYRGYEPAFQLDGDDIIGIQALYGRKTNSVAPTPGGASVPNPPPESAGIPDPRLCLDAKIDTIFNSAEGETYAFKGDYFWKLTEDSVAVGYPKAISKTWPGLPGNIDAAFTYKNGKTYFFKGTKYWRYAGKRMDGEYPKDISDGFTGIPDNVDSALVWSGNGKIYFYKGTKFWRFDPTQRPPVKSTYPKPISNWEGVPNNMDAAFQYTNGYTYFFKDGAYYRFNDRTFSVDVADPAFPRSTGYWWFGCKNLQSGTVGGRARQISSEDSYADKSNDDMDVGDIVYDAGGERDSEYPQDRNSSAQVKSSSILIAFLCCVLLMLVNKNSQLLK